MSILPTIAYGSTSSGVQSPQAGPAIYVGGGAPGTLEGPPGSLYIDIDNELLYIKATAGAGGWSTLVGPGGGPITWAEITGDPEAATALTTAIDAHAAVAVTDHEAEPDPHVVYLTQAEANALYEAIGAVAAHAAASNPHPVYVTEAEGAGLYDSLGAAAAAVAAHEAAGDPHPGYLTAAEGNAAYQALDATLTALAALNASAGLVEQTGADTFAKRALGVGAGTSVPTRADADARYEPIGAAAAAVAAHEAAGDPHPGYTTAAELSSAIAAHEGAADPHPTYTTAAELSAAIAAHEGAANPHPTYLTQAEGDAAYAPLVHATRHQSGGADPIKLDDLAAPDDNTDLNASASAHGLMQKYPGGTTNFLRADGTFAAPPGGAGAFAVTQAIVSPPYPASRRHTVNVVDAAMAATDKILVSLAGVAETQANASDSVDPLSMQALPKAGSFDLQLSFLTPAAGPIVINYSRAA